MSSSNVRSTSIFGVNINKYFKLSSNGLNGPYAFLFVKDQIQKIFVLDFPETRLTKTKKKGQSIPLLDMSDCKIIVHHVPMTSSFTLKVSHRMLSSKCVHVKNYTFHFGNLWMQDDESEICIDGILKASPLASAV